MKENIKKDNCKYLLKERGYIAQIILEHNLALDKEYEKLKRLESLIEAFTCLRLKK